jgi:pimeloyl-ACP methyl ester carboxylesterase
MRLADLKFVLDQLQKLQIPGAWFAGKLDLSRIAVMGHSLGAEVALSSLQRDPRVDAAVLLDAPIVDEDVRGTSKPVLLLIAGREPWSHAECQLWSNLRGPHLAVILNDADHFTPTDAVWLFRNLPGLALRSEGDNAVTAIRNAVADFLDSNLRGSNARPITTFSYGHSTVVRLGNQALCRENPRRAGGFQ